ncbi:helix-turn-helix domain-containing protein [Bradyrhizobium sp. AUGA SZCCT0431]|uniref:helix-turn-helix domain-containing protein n=1 Tax=Bradyrhizobium sp. AUGA SZCCT0431 TaxID=2807674 RepID=UPI001BAC9D32|nr:helix-turn-helix transcriptional regulator [Bradyrhizobium sp. AUGA SZCCT0431]MBR1147544.1 helix-turn-helix transcriptional regulator [Bradyrhizobium sp. AUGA SZCCT0431]
MDGAEKRNGCYQTSIVDGRTASVDFKKAACRNELQYVQRFERVVLAMKRSFDQPMTNRKMADIACLSPCHFNRLFHNATGIPPVQFHYALRLDHAKRLLVSTDLSVTEICFEVGYNSLGTFISRFNQLVGISPSAFRSWTRQFSSTRLIELGLTLLDTKVAPALSRSICGTVSSAGCDGLIFTALFPRAIPEGVPAACALSSASGPYHLSQPSRGGWYVFAVVIPRAAAGMQLITLDGLRRGRSGPIRVEENGWTGSSNIELRSARMLDPPVLTAVPVLLSRVLADRTLRFSAQRSPRALCDASLGRV